jgi:lipooligosaccharide transport system permease protein
MATPAAVRVWESHLTVYRRIWWSNVLGSFLQPLLYLLGMGVGVGALVDKRPTSTDALAGHGYLAFLAPALIATTAMLAVAQEAMWPVLDGFLWSRAYRAMSATPLRAGEIVGGLALWSATRALISGGGVALVLVGFDDTRHWGLLAAVGFGVLTGLAFSQPIAAWASTRDATGQSFPAINRFVLIPMFLFAGAFYPVSQLPGWMHPIAYATPLWHGVELCRGATLGTLGAAAAGGHVAVLLAYALAGHLVLRRTFARRLAT